MDVFLNEFQNIVVLRSRATREYEISLKAGNMFMNRFCIDEDASFELSGVYDVNNNLRKKILGETSRGKAN